MYLIKQVYRAEEQSHTWEIYKYINNKWQFDFTFNSSRTHFLKLLQHTNLKLEYAIISFDKFYRNLFYTVYPNIKVIIDKMYVTNLFQYMVYPSMQTYDEIAIAMEYGQQHISKAEQYFDFIHVFYTMDSKEEAIGYYELWQTYMPINDKKISRFIGVMEQYIDEIVNYFENRAILEIIR